MECGVDKRHDIEHVQATEMGLCECLFEIQSKICLHFPFWDVQQVTQAGEMLILTFGLQLAYASRNSPIKGVKSILPSQK